MVVYVTESDRLPTLSLISLSASSISSSSRRRAYNKVNNNSVNNDTNTCRGLSSVNINNNIDNSINDIKTKLQKKRRSQTIQQNWSISDGWKHIQDIVPIAIVIRDHAIYMITWYTLKKLFVVVQRRNFFFRGAIGWN